MLIGQIPVMMFTVVDLEAARDNLKTWAADPEKPTISPWYLQNYKKFDSSLTVREMLL